jgi:phage terminase large subunit-like protein
MALKAVPVPRGQARPFTAEHFRQFASLLVYDDGERHDLEGWQLDFVRDLFRGFRETWLLVPEGNGKSTLVAAIALYGAHFTARPWIPIGASSRDQAMILYTQAKAFVEQTPGFLDVFKCHDGYRRIKSRNGGEGIKIYPWDPATGDGVIPYPYAILDELHRHTDLRLYRLWKGKLRKRGASIVTISTAGEPGTEFEEARDRIRDLAGARRRRGGRLRATGNGVVMHEYMLEKVEHVTDMRRVKSVNPLSSITVADLRDEFASPTTDLGDWKRLKCNIPARSASAAITDREWDDALDKQHQEIPEGDRVDVGADVAWKHDTFSIVPLLRLDGYRLLGPATILTPPRDGSSMHPDVVKRAFEVMHERNPIDTVVIDMERAEDIAAWLEDELAVTVIDRGQSNPLHAEDYENFMEGLRNGTLKHTGDPGLRRHVMHAVARTLPGGRRRFDRPSQSRAKRRQDERVIDALSAAGMVNTYAAETHRDTEPMVAWG